MNSKKIFINACYGNKVDRTPIWIMRQAGRYLPEYREIRKKHTFHQMMHTPELMEKVTMLPLNRYQLDAAIMFSDILVIPEALGMNFKLVPSIGPVFNNTLDINDLIKNLNYNDKYFLNIYDGIKNIKNTLNNEKALIGFSGSPWTIACYMIEGKPSKDYRNIRSLIYENQKSYHLLMDKLTNTIITYLKGQIIAGVDAIQIFDTNGSFLSKSNFEKFSLPYIKRIIDALNQFNIPIILFVKGGGHWLELLEQSGANVLGIDWTISLKYAKEQIKNRISLQGNLDPAVLLSSNEIITDEVKKVLKSYGKGYGHIFNLGHGITPDVSPDAVQTIINTIFKESPNYK